MSLTYVPQPDGLDVLQSDLGMWLFSRCLTF